MRKTILTLSVLALIASSCGQATKKQSNTIASDSIRIIDETCLIEIMNCEGDCSYSEDVGVYALRAAEKFEKMGIKKVNIPAGQSYLSFALDNDENYIVDTKGYCFADNSLLYKKGKKPIFLSTFELGFSNDENEWKKITNYLTASTMPSQSYVGLWHDYDNAPNELTILEIGDNKIEFEISFFRNYGANGTARMENNEIVFVLDNDKSGKMKFNENSISFTVDSSDYEFTIKIENKQYAEKPKFLWQSDEFVMSFYEDGTAQFSRIFNEKIIYLSTSKYLVFPTYIQFDNDNTWEFFDDFGNVSPSWKIFNYHKISGKSDEGIEIIEEYFRESGDGMP